MAAHFLWILVIGLGTFAVWYGVRQQGDTLARARREGVIRIGYAVEAPYAFLTPSGEVTGESPEVARRMVARLGIPRVEWCLAEFGNLIKGLESWRFDVVAAGMFITAERAERVSFSVPTFRVRSGLLVPRGNPRHLHSYADLVQRGGVRIAVLSGSVEERQLLDDGFAKERLRRVPDARSGGALVAAGEADGLTLSAPTLRWMVKHGGIAGVELAEPFEVVENSVGAEPRTGAFVFRRKEGALREAWNKELRRFVGSEEHRQLVMEFGFSSTELPRGESEKQEAVSP